MRQIDMKSLKNLRWTWSDHERSKRYLLDESEELSLITLRILKQKKRLKQRKLAPISKLCFILQWNTLSKPHLRSPSLDKKHMNQHEWMESRSAICSTSYTSPSFVEDGINGRKSLLISWSLSQQCLLRVPAWTSFIAVEQEITSRQRSSSLSNLVARALQELVSATWGRSL